MKKCLNCNGDIPAYKKINGKVQQLTSRSYCLSCSPFRARNTKRIHIKKIRPLTKHCLECGRKFKWKKNSVCSTCRSFKRRDQQRTKAIDLCGGKCFFCKNNDYDVLTFHHRNPKTKKFNLCNNWQKNWNELKLEIQKCDLLCANCHMKFHRKEKF